MRLIILALLLALAFGTAQAYPLQGSDGTASVTLFGSIRTPLVESTTMEILKVDIGLMGTENATYKLTDANNSLYEPGLYKTLSSGRQLVYFLIPKDDLFKLITATPLGGKSININWWARPKASNENLVIRYYGITDWLTNPDEQGIVVQVTAQSNVTQSQLVSPENFTLLDQWDWPYNPTLGFDPEVVGPQKATGRLSVGFTPISLFSKPAALVYDYNTAHPIVIDLEKNLVPLTDSAVYGANATKSAANVQTALPAQASTVATTPKPAANQTNQTASAPANNSTGIKLTSLKDKIAAVQLRLGAAGSSNSSGQKSKISESINSSLNAARERLAATKANLTKKTQNNTSKSTSKSNATLNNTLNSKLNSTLNSTLNKTPNGTTSSMSNSMSSISA
jgi:hypothetical protein